MLVVHILTHGKRQDSNGGIQKQHPVPGDVAAPDLEELIAKDHPVRIVNEILNRLRQQTEKRLKGKRGTKKRKQRRHSHQVSC